MIDKEELAMRMAAEGYNVSTFAEAVGISRNALYTMSNPRMSTICAIAEALRLRPGEIERLFFKDVISSSSSSEKEDNMTKEDFKKIESALIERILKEIKTETELPALMAALHTLNVVKDYPQNYQC